MSNSYVRDGLKFIFISTCFICSMSCKKHKEFPNIVYIDTAAVSTHSSSMYQSAFLSVVKIKRVFRKNTMVDSVSQDVMMMGYFYKDSTNEFHNLLDTPGRVFFDNIMLSGPNDIPTQFYNDIYVFDSVWETVLNNASWRVVSRNNVNDLDYADGSIPYYNDTLPRVITRSAGLILKIDSTTVINADSVKITIGDGVSYISTTVGPDVGYAVFSPNSMSSFQTTNSWGGFVAVEVFKTRFIYSDGRRFHIANNRKLYFTININ